MVSALPTEDDDDHDDALNLSGSERTESQRRVPSVSAVYFSLIYAFHA
jgi:hypothetical protein